MKGQNKALENMGNLANTAFSAIKDNEAKQAATAAKTTKKQAYSGRMPAALWQKFSEINAESGTPNTVKINQLVADYVANYTNSI